MHGIIFNQLQKFIRSLADEQTAKAIYEKAGVGSKFYDTTKAHPDEELVAILTAACQTLNVDRDTALKEFGKFITPGLLSVYGAYLDPSWKCMDLLERIEDTIHRAVRRTNASATPPNLKVKRTKPTEVEIEYTSPRNMISLGIGIIEKIAEHYKETVVIRKTAIPNGTKLTVVRTN